MKGKQILIVIALFISSHLMAQKAYDIVTYTTNFQGSEIKYLYGNGYVEASEIRISKKEFYQDANFDYISKDGVITQKYNVKEGYILIYLDSSDVNNNEDIEQIKGDYFYKGKKYPLEFTK